VTVTKQQAFEALNLLCEYFHAQSKKNGWWLERKVLPSGHAEVIDHTTYEDPFFIATKLALIHSETSEGLEGFRKDLPDDKLPHYPALAVELADGIIRNCDLAGRYGYKLGDICREKDAYNDVREDHKTEARLGKFGKKF
jgi:hypothetical protein